MDKYEAASTNATIAEIENQRALMGTRAANFSAQNAILTVQVKDLTEEIAGMMAVIAARDTTIAELLKKFAPAVDTKADAPFALKSVALPVIEVPLPELNVKP